MRPDNRRGPASSARRWLAFYRLQARLVWEWRPARLAIVRRTVLTYLAACLALAITAGVLSGLSIDGLGTLLLVALLLVALDSLSSVVLHWLLVPWPIFVAQVLGLVIQVGVIIALGRVGPGVVVDGPTTAIWAAVLLTVSATGRAGGSGRGRSCWPRTRPARGTSAAVSTTASRGRVCSSIWTASRLGRRLGT